ncbi:malto-oligosyltrehalose trehalohydrolase [Solwaraspora sp. WMMD937]|uniref:malto-oligosyltrehalose trehalohydrolase n=1 Tax=Solwaraspora sp. WMMD937 TaxID=3016090 RepID=UPI00249A32E6|nr:malto-oligosyltrehalose trehalohydrolase [Solwaraspora sp. WMMD937]WFE20065.1 malto-oligosyltrehalose trehalohydrolase [Solwaraspora sp. WMMD937]
MHRFSVWAPLPTRVTVRVDGRDHAMTASGGGWWYAEVADARPGTDYAFLLDDDPTALPDPRSVWQPDGVHGPSRRYDHAAYRWRDSGWRGRPLAGAVLYQLHVGTFTDEGTFDAAIDRLDHLVRLGADFVQLLPVNAFEGDAGWGYDGVLWYAVHEPYGGPDALKRFVDACHQRGLGVLLDVVHNHLGPAGAYSPRFAPYFADQTRWGPALNLDGDGSDEVRRYVLDNVVSWLRDFHLDGLRLDAVQALRDGRAVHLLEEMAETVDALAAHLGRPLVLLAESDQNDPRLVTPREAGGYGLTALWNDDVHHSLHAALSGERQGYYADYGPLRTLGDALRDVFVYAGRHSSFRGRSYGRPVDTTRIPASRFLVYVQSHDQIGNRAGGERISAVLNPGLLSCAAAIVLCSPYTPMIFMGEEWGSRGPWQFFVSFADAELREAVRLGRRAELGATWGVAGTADPGDRDTFLGSKLRWSELAEPDHDRLFTLYRDLIALRRSRPELTDPRLNRIAVEVDEHRRWLVMRRGGVRLVCNLADVEQPVPFGAPSGKVLLSSAPVQSGDAQVVLPAESFAVLAATG